MEAGLPEERLALVDMAARIASEEGVPLYLVGGAVRDLLLGRPTEDLDLVVEGDAETLAAVIAKRMSGDVVSRSQFATVKLKVWGSSLDMVTARNESYARPGALPQIAHGTMREDLARRDFTINAMAWPLHLGSAAGLLDPHDGLRTTCSAAWCACSMTAALWTTPRASCERCATSSGWASRWRSGRSRFCVATCPCWTPSAATGCAGSSCCGCRRSDALEILARADALGVLAGHPPCARRRRRVRDSEAAGGGGSTSDPKVCLALLGAVWLSGTDAEAVVRAAADASGLGKRGEGHGGAAGAVLRSIAGRHAESPSRLYDLPRAVR